MCACYYYLLLLFSQAAIDYCLLQPNTLPDDKKKAVEKMLAEKIPDEAIRTAFVATYELVLQQFGVDSLKKERERIAAEREHIAAEREHIAAKEEHIAAEREHIAAKEERIAAEREHIAESNKIQLQLQLKSLDKTEHELGK
ncbi:MAG TPA: hypothetical protein VHA52_02445 [Candidatus Babeliaceae bacterium]|nr:hypothetical protein [Candidatus Babeliaceae bacterium]